MKKNLLLTAVLSIFTAYTFGQTFYINEDFNASALPTGWTTVANSGTQSWSFGVDGASAHAGNNNLDGTAMAYFDDDALGGGSLNNTATINSPVFNNSVAPISFLEFDYNFREFGTNTVPDSFLVEVYDGLAWNRVMSLGLDDCGNYTVLSCNTNFPHAVIDISAYRNANCQVRFRYEDGNDWGWYAALDNVEIYSPYANNVGVVAVLDPISGCGLTSTETVQVTIQNFGFANASNFNVTYRASGAGTQTITENVSAIIAAGATLNYTFTGTANLSTLGDYNIDVYTSLGSDQDNSNDTMSVVATNEQIYVPTYSEGFETANSNWKVSGTNNSWARGIPAGPVINTAAEGVNAFVTNLTGAYNNNELSYLTSACFDFSANPADPILAFSTRFLVEQGFDFFWLESSIDNGLTWTKVLANPTFTPVNWYNNAPLQVWTGNSQGWINVENTLNGLGGESQVKLRFVFSSDGSSVLDGVGIDKFSIRNPQAKDLSLNEISYPASAQAPLCGYGVENIIIEYENKGVNPIDTIYASYRVDNNPPVTDTVILRILPGAVASYQFRTRFDFSAIRTYNLSAWVHAPGDGFAVNDSIFNIPVNNVSSNSVSIPYRENFDQGHVPDDANFSALNDVLGRGWTRFSNGIPSTNQYTWRLRTIRTGSGNTGPDQDHTGGAFAYTEASSQGVGTVGTLVSPCLNLSNNSGARLIFYYHRFGTQMGSLFVDVYDGSQWVNNVDIIAPRPQTSGVDPFTERQVNLNQFAGRRIKVRFRAISQGCCAGDMAIDDIYIYEPLAKDVALADVTAPVSGCEISSASSVSVEINNPGTLPSIADSIYVYYQVDNRAPVKDTVRVAIPSEQSYNFTFSTPTDLGTPGQTYVIKAWTDMVGDLNINNDTLRYYEVKNNTIDITNANYAEDFETFRMAYCDQPIGQVMENGWFAPLTDFGWNIQRSTCGNLDLTTPTTFTGPEGDHTTGRGMFLYAESFDVNGDGLANTPAILESPCIDLSTNTDAKMSFWYHKYGNGMGTLFVDVYDNGAWINGVAQINGQTQTSTSQNWKIQEVNLTPYVGGLVQIRFRGIKGSDRSDMAIDDVVIFDPSLKDVAITEVTSPTGAGCNLSSSSPIRVRLANFGTQAINANEVTISYKLNEDVRVFETVNVAIPIGGNILYTFSQNADLTVPGTLEFKFRADLTGDSVQANNYFVQRVYNHNMGLPYSIEDFERHRPGGNAAPGGYPLDYMKDWGRSPNPAATRPQWHVWNGPGPMVGGEPMPNPPIPPNGPSGDHTFATKRANGVGTYMLYESKFRPPPGSTGPGTWPDASLIAPCGGIDLSNSVNNRLLLSFWYHRFGVNMPDVFVDVYNGTQWINGVAVIRGVQHGTKDDPWLNYQVSLDQFAGVSNANLRFRAKFLGIGGDMGLDDFLIMDRITRDITVIKMERPRDRNTTDRCGMSNRERVIVRVQNTGTSDVLKLNMCYQITWTPLDGDPIVLPQVCDSLVGILISAQNRGATYSYEFPTRADLSQPGRYQFKIWSQYPGDGYAFNDTIRDEVVNETRPFPYCENFSSAVTGWTGGDFFEGTYPNTWKAGTAAYTFKTSIEGDNGYTTGHTGGINDVFLLADDADGMRGQIATIESPCFDLTNATTANLDFWYKAPADDHFLLIEISRGQGGGPWEVLDTLYGPPGVTSWTPVRFVLADYTGTFVRFRFRGENTGGGYYAIDDFCLIVPPKQQIEMERIPSPLPNLCQYFCDEIPVVRLQNIGNDAIDSFRIRFAVDKTVQTFPYGNWISDTSMWFYRGIHYNIFEAGDKLDLSLDSFPVPMCDKDLYWMYATVYLPGDLDSADNIVENYFIDHPVPFPITHVLDFEDNVDPYGGWLHGAEGFYAETVKSGLDQGGLTGPADDHTLQNGTGSYWVTQAAAGDPGNRAVLQSQCVDLFTATNPEISYWYHMFGFQMGNLMLEVNDDFGWKRVDSLKGQDPNQPRNSAPWINRKIPLPQYANDYVRFRFLSFRGGGSASDMGVDDIIIYDQPPKDVKPANLAKPTDDITSCYSAFQELYVNVQNNGGDSLRYDQDTLKIAVYIDKNGIAWDTLYRTVSSDVWANSNGFLRAHPSDTTVAIKMDGTFDMYHIGDLFGFAVSLKLQNDEIPINDSAYYQILAREEGGNIASVFPYDTVCSREPVQITLENYFGAITWEERTVTKDGNGFWIPGNFPLSLPTYLTFPDTNIYLRAKICGKIFPNMDSVEVIKPYQPTIFDSSKCQANPAAIPLRIETPSNVEFVYVYNSKEAADSLVDSTRLSNSGNNKYVFSHSGDTTRSYYFRSGIQAPVYINPITNQLVDTVCLSQAPHSIGTATVIDTAIFVNMPSVGNLTLDTICRDYFDNIGIDLDAGAQAGLLYTYRWTIERWPVGATAADSVWYDSTQTVTVDPWVLEKETEYRYSVYVETSESPICPMQSGEYRVFVDNKCFTSLEENELSENLDIYPNPTSDKLYLQYNLNGKVVKADVKILTLAGKLLLERTNIQLGRNAEEFDLNELPKGVYFIQIDTEEDRFIQKIIKS